jgi:EAL domain-containing protein (putative c-di-GMP-specific phosphodiesterase class I)
VSARSLLDSAFPDLIEKALQRAGVAGDLLCVEITENTVMADPDLAIEVLHRIRRLGVTTSIDDFGTGYSSMSVLSELPTDALKIDRAFVMESASRRTSRSVVEAIISIAHLLGKSTVAEGVETSDQVRTLRELGCDFAQGYFFAKPVSAEQLPDVIARVPAWRQIVRDAAIAEDRSSAESLDGSARSHAG